MPGQDTGFDDPCRLAAKFVVWLVAKNAETNALGAPAESNGPRPLDFTGVEVVQKDRADTAYRYFVDCVAYLTFAAPSPYAGRRPTVRWEQA